MAVKEIISFDSKLLDTTSVYDSTQAKKQSVINAEVLTALENKINYSDALSLEEIEASTSLTNKVASADAAKSIKESLLTIPIVNSGSVNYSSYTLADAIKQASIDLPFGMYWTNFVVSGASYEMMAKRYSWGIVGIVLPYGSGTAYRFYDSTGGTPVMVQL